MQEMGEKKFSSNAPFMLSLICFDILGKKNTKQNDNLPANEEGAGIALRKIQDIHFRPYNAFLGNFVTSNKVFQQPLALLYCNEKCPQVALTA